MVKFLRLLPVLAVLGFAGFAATPATAAPATQQMTVTHKDTANVYHNRWHRGDRMMWNRGGSWDRNRSYGWDRRCRTVERRVYNERRGRYVTRTTRVCR